MLISSTDAFLCFKHAMACFFITNLLLVATLERRYLADATGPDGDWDEIVVEREQRATILECIHTRVRPVVNINWMAKPLGADDWKLLLSASERDKFSGGASKPSTRLADPDFALTGNFSLLLQPAMRDAGLYMCLVEQRGETIKEKIILLAIITVSSNPPSPVPRNSTLRLIAKVTPESACERISWHSPAGSSLKTALKPIAGFVTKVPWVTLDDAGPYRCTVHPVRSANDTAFTFPMSIAVDAVSVASYTRVQHGPPIFTATQARTSFPLTCPSVQGDCVSLYWQGPNSNKSKLLYQHNRWRGTTLNMEESRKLQLADSPYNADGGSFSFVRTPGLKDGGLYVCKVLVNDHIFSQRTLLSVLKVMGRRLGSKLQVECLFSEVSQVQEAKWEYQNKSQRLAMRKGRGNISTVLPLPITSDTAGNYTCTLRLKNGQTISAVHSVQPQERAEAPSSHSSSVHLLLALLLLVPLVAATVAVLLWQQKRNCRQGIEQSLSGHSGETENIYENPEDVRQALPQGSVYMDLKSRQEDVYKKLER
ncbi:g6f-like isoform X1 [Syngnathus scovelli]|uniref:g6f-like isoform X1 n=2 Tax=Syngnathus scovelli TaxID=161590 RepID=UPI002110360F|nr:g6f-like isoform X1 [Syngnathus scovelli]XP_049587572.1 g6f-like isoform X1 [Syngnathus scovelli]XP_049587573.1 g6f-like isoform X1 [Syngnathus scovelli]